MTNTASNRELIELLERNNIGDRWRQRTLEALRDRKAEKRQAGRTVVRDLLVELKTAHRDRAAAEDPELAEALEELLQVVAASAQQVYVCYSVPDVASERWTQIVTEPTVRELFGFGPKRLNERAVLAYRTIKAGGLHSAVIESLQKQEPPPEVLDVVMRGEDESFDTIVRLLHEGALSEREQVNVVARLLLLTRNMCHERTGELLDVCLELMESPSLVVRSRGPTRPSASCPSWKVSESLAVATSSESAHSLHFASRSKPPSRA